MCTNYSTRSCSLNWLRCIYTVRTPNPHGGKVSCKQTFTPTQLVQQIRRLAITLGSSHYLSCVVYIATSGMLLYVQSEQVHMRIRI